MTQPLFRSEVFEARRTSWLGPISLSQPLGLWVLTGFAGASALIVILFLVFGTYTRRSHVSGQLVPVQGMATVLAPATGVVARLDIVEGGMVTAGQTVAVITAPRATLSEGDMQSALQARIRRRYESVQEAREAQRQLLDTQASGLSTQLTTARRELILIQREIGLRQQQVRLAEDASARFRKLQENGYVSEVQVQEQEVLALELLGEVQALQRQFHSMGRQIGEIEQSLGELPGQLQVNETNFQREVALLEQEQIETMGRGELAIVAPVSGVVATLLFKPGQAVQEGEVLMSVLPGDGELEAELLVPSRAIGFIEPGDTVLLRYQAFPYQKFGHQQGEVARISRSALGSRLIGSSLENSLQSEPVYRVTVSLVQQNIYAYGQVEPLRPGMLLDADILGERRRLFEWVLEPLYSLHGRVSDAASSQSSDHLSPNVVSRPAP